MNETPTETTTTTTDLTWFVQTCFIRNDAPPVLNLYGPYTKPEADKERRRFLEQFQDDETRPWDSILIAKVNQTANHKAAQAVENQEN